MKTIVDTVSILCKVFISICMMVFAQGQSSFAFGAAAISGFDGRSTALRDEENQKVIIIRGSPSVVSDADI